MTILMNTMTAEGDMVEKRPTQVKDTLIGRLSDGDMTDLLVLKNKSPQWNDGKPRNIHLLSTKFNRPILTLCFLSYRDELVRSKLWRKSVFGVCQELSNCPR